MMNTNIANMNSIFAILAFYKRVDKGACDMLGNIFILGDSYSTFKGYIPDEYAFYYSQEGPNYIKKREDQTLREKDVCSVRQTWWHDLCKENGNLVMNCSWSGTTICNTGYGGSDNKEISFIGRFEKLLQKGFFKENSIDTFFLFGGTNDSWADAPLGNPVFSDWSAEELYNVRGGFSYLVSRLVKEFGCEKIYCIINSELKDEIGQFYKEVCKKENVTFIELHDIEKIEGHPTVEGMKKIKEQVIECVGKVKKYD